MDQEAIYFGENSIIKSAFQKNKRRININKVDIERIKLSDIKIIPIKLLFYWNDFDI